MIETDVLIVGSGPAGSSSALFLSTYGVENLVITKYRWTANTPRAHITNQRAVEIMRDMGLEGEIKAKGVPQPLMGDTVFCTSLAGDELARLHTWGTHPARLADYTLASPCIHYDLPQDIFEPIILGNAASRGSRVRFDTEYLTHVQDADGFQTLITHVFVEGDEYLDSDAVFGVRENLIGPFERHEPGTAPDGREMDVPFWTMRYDMVLAP